MSDSDRGFALGPDPLSNGFVDNRDKRIYALEAENVALKAERDAANLRHLELIETKMDANEVLRAELRNVYADLAAARQSRARLVGAVRAQLARLDRLSGELVETACAEERARQSRARLVGLVRHLRAWFSATAPDSAFVKRITDERDAEMERHANNHAAWTAANEELRDAHQRALNERDALKAERDRDRARYAESEQEINRHVRRLTAERDAARAWAAVWRKALKYWRDVALQADENSLFWFKQQSRARRIGRAAEAMERR